MTPPVNPPPIAVQNKINAKAVYVTSGAPGPAFQNSPAPSPGLPHAAAAPSPVKHDVETEESTPAAGATDEVASDESEPARDLAPFDKTAAADAIRNQSRLLSHCYDPVIGRVSTRAAITFAPSGHATQVVLDPVPGLQGTPVVGCVVRKLREATVPEFSGEQVTAKALVTIE